MGQRQRRASRERGERKWPWESKEEFEKRQINPQVRRMRNRKPAGSTIRTRAAEQSARDKAVAAEQLVEETPGAAKLLGKIRKPRKKASGSVGS